MIKAIDRHKIATIQTGTTMRYDANGNMLCDSARMISAVRYNILNLPDTIQFINGNQIVNLYDAAGRKYKSIAYIVQETAVTPRYEIVHYTFDVDTIDYIVTEYAGNIETRYTRTDTITQRIHNSIGYYTDSTYYHYIKDHLGNVCAVVHSTADTLIQSTLYYASGVPMAQSFGRDKQPYLYNGKEFVEAHGLNTYDYGFRGYYAPIGRFTAIDPLAEQTPWQSPYSYAGNRFVNAIDWMGLGGITGFSHSDGTCHWVAIDGEGTIVGLDLEHWDKGVYEVDDEWNHTYWDLLRYEIIGNHLGLGAGWGIGTNIKGKFNQSGGGYYNKELGRWIPYGIKPIEDTNLMHTIAEHELLIFLHENPIIADYLYLLGEYGNNITKYPGIRSLKQYSIGCYAIY